MLKHAVSIDRWNVHLATGPTVEVWADGYQELDGYYVFGVLADADAESEIDGLDVTGRTPSNPLRVIVTLARFRVDEVAQIASA
jgi:hypothetical protein